MNQNSSLSPALPVARARRQDGAAARPSDPHESTTRPANSEPHRALLDPAQRYRALYHDLPALRTALGTHPAYLVDLTLEYVFDTIGPTYERELAETQTPDEYLTILRQAAIEAESRFRMHPVFRRQLTLDALPMPEISRLIPFQLAAYLDARRCFWLRD